MTLKYVTTLELNEYLNMWEQIPHFEEGKMSDKEIILVGDRSKTLFSLDHFAPIGNTLVLTTSGGTSLAVDVDYTFDYNTGKGSLTTAGLANVGTSDVLGEYKYNKLGVINSVVSDLCEAAEKSFDSDTEVTFANFTDSNPSYIKVSDEVHIGRDNPNRVYYSDVTPIVKFSTTNSSAYTTGGTGLTLTSVVGLPGSGTVYVDGQKVSYTSISGNVLTVPSSTSSVGTSSTIVGEVVEISRESEGSEPSYTVLDPDTEYMIDYDTGNIKLLDPAYLTDTSGQDRLYSENLLVRTSYMSAWHDIGQDPVIPDDSKEAVLMLAARRFVSRVVRSTNVKGMQFGDGFMSQHYRFDEGEYKSIVEKYKQLQVANVGAGRQYLS